MDFFFWGGGIWFNLKTAWTQAVTTYAGAAATNLRLLLQGSVVRVKQLSGVV